MHAPRVYKPVQNNDFLGVTLLRETCFQRNWAYVEAMPHEHDRIVIANTAMVFGSTRHLKDPKNNAIPLTPGCRIQMTCNVWKNGRPVILNGEFATFHEWTDPSDFKIKAIEPSHKTTDPRGGAAKKTTFPTWSVINQRRCKGMARVTLHTDGSTHLIGKLKNRGFPFECAQWTRLHRLQGQSTSSTASRAPPPPLVFFLAHPPRPFPHPPSSSFFPRASPTKS